METCEVKAQSALFSSQQASFNGQFPRRSGSETLRVDCDRTACSCLDYLKGQYRLSRFRFPSVALGLMRHQQGRRSSTTHSCFNNMAMCTHDMCRRQESIHSLSLIDSSSHCVAMSQVCEFEYAS